MRCCERWAKALLLPLGGFLVVAPPAFAEDDDDLEDLEELHEDLADDLEDRVERLPYTGRRNLRKVAER